MEKISILTDCNSWKFYFLAGKNHNERNAYSNLLGHLPVPNRRHGSNNSDGWERGNRFCGAGGGVSDVPVRPFDVVERRALAVNCMPANSYQVVVMRCGQRSMAGGAYDRSLGDNDEVHRSAQRSAAQRRQC